MLVIKQRGDTSCWLLNKGVTHNGNQTIDALMLVYIVENIHYFDSSLIC